MSSSAWSAINLKRSHDLHEPAIWSRETSQRITCSDRCQLTKPWMSSIKEGRYKPRVHVLCQPVTLSTTTMLHDFVVAVTVIVHTRPQAILLAMITMGKSTHRFRSPSYSIWVWSSVWKPEGQPELRYYVTIQDVRKNSS